MSAFPIQVVVELLRRWVARSKNVCVGVVLDLVELGMLLSSIALELEEEDDDDGGKDGERLTKRRNRVFEEDLDIMSDFIYLNANSYCCIPSNLEIQLLKIQLSSLFL